MALPEFFRQKPQPSEMTIRQIATETHRRGSPQVIVRMQRFGERHAQVNIKTDGIAKLKRTEILSGEPEALPHTLFTSALDAALQLHELGIRAPIVDDHTILTIGDIIDRHEQATKR